MQQEEADVRIVPAALLMLVILPARAEWVKASENPSGVYYFDPATVLKEGNLRRVWQMNDLKVRKKDGELSRFVQYEYDCKEDLRRIRFLSTHDGPMTTGKVIVGETSTGSWNPVPSDTNASIVLKLVCSH
jgi:hypothetical protein